MDFLKIYLSADTEIEKEVTQEVNGFVKVAKRVGNECLEFLDDYWMNFIGAILIYFIGRKIVALLAKIIERGLERSSIELSVCKFLNKLIFYVLNVILIVSVLGCLGIQTSSFVAIIGSIGLAVGLSLQGSLANFAGGVLILILKPFKVNDYIISNNVEGRVKTIDIFYTKLITPDNKKVTIPNGVLSNSVVQTVSQVSKRRIDLVIPIEYGEDIRKVREALIEVANNNEKVKQSSGIDVMVKDLASSAIEISFKTWVATADYIVTRAELLEEVIYKFREEGINIPFDQLDLNLKKEIMDNMVKLEKE